MKNAVIYARYSSHAQKTTSIDGQVRECIAYAKQKGYNVVGVYKDEAKSAKTDARPGFKEMIKNAASGTFDAVIVYTLDRFSRSRIDAALYKKELKAHGVRVLSACENIDGSPSSVILEAVLEGLAEHYSLELAAKVSRGMHDNATKGKYNGGPAPYGYRASGGRLVIEEKEAAVVREIFERRAAGETYVSISKSLNARGLRHKRSPWSPRMLRTITNKPVYTGSYTWGGITTENAHTAIVSRELFEACAPSPLATNTTGRPASYPLSGRIICPVCGGRVVGTSGHGKSGTKYRYYSCKKQRAGGDCTGFSVPAFGLERLIVEHTVRALNNKPALDAIAAQVVAVQQSDLAGAMALNEARAALAANKKAAANLIQALEAAPAAAASIGERLAELEIQRAQLEATVARERARVAPVEFTAEHIVFFMEQMLKSTKKDAGATLLAAFVDKVTPVEGGYMVAYNYMPDLPALDTPIFLECSLKYQMVDHQGLEPWTP